MVSFMRKHFILGLCAAAFAIFVFVGCGGGSGGRSDSKPKPGADVTTSSGPAGSVARDGDATGGREGRDSAGSAGRWVRQARAAAHAVSHRKPDQTPAKGDSHRRLTAETTLKRLVDGTGGNGGGAGGVQRILKSPREIRKALKHLEKESREPGSNPVQAIVEQLAGS
jgi:hypothetical protein